MCFGGGEDKSSKKMVKMQEQEAATARIKENERQARIAQGLANIKAAFHGGNMIKRTTGNFTAAAPSAGVALPAGYSYVNVGGSPARAAVSGTSGGGGTVRGGGGGNRAEAAYGTTGPIASGGGSGQARNNAVTQPTAIGSSGTPGTAGTPGKWMVRGPDGQMYDIGTSVDWSKDDVTGTSAGFGKEFFDKYKQGMLDYYQPQVESKYGDSKKELTYRLARAGTLRSTAAIDSTADLSKQYDVNTTKIKSDADTAAATLRNRVAQEEQNATNTLYSTENPDVAANAATAAVTNISAEKPDLSPLGSIFDIAAIGGANFLKGGQNAYYANQAKSAYPTTSRYGATKTYA